MSGWIFVLVFLFAIVVIYFLDEIRGELRGIGEDVFEIKNDIRSRLDAARALWIPCVYLWKRNNG